MGGRSAKECLLPFCDLARRIGPVLQCHLIGATFGAQNQPTTNHGNGYATPLLIRPPACTELRALETRERGIRRSNSGCCAPSRHRGQIVEMVLIACGSGSWVCLPPVWVCGSRGLPVQVVTDPPSDRKDSHTLDLGNAAQERRLSADRHRSEQAPARAPDAVRTQAGCGSGRI